MYLLIPAAGSGKRMGGDRNKLLLELAGKPVLAWTLLAAEGSSAIDWIGIIGQPDDFADFKQIITDLRLQALPDVADRVLIHDGARCLATPELFDRCAAALLEHDALVAAVTVKDTIKVVDAQGYITSTPDRANLWAAQTPQGFSVALLKKCHAQGLEQGWEVTDDAALLERCGLPVLIVTGEETNLKVTTPGDLAIAAFVLQAR
jgi:2-C-methyl-D-erythritol 4-phosphate cytidylyltransferase